VINIKKTNKIIQRILNNSGIATDIRIFMLTKTAGDDYDPYEKNWTIGNLNPITIKGYVREISYKSLVWRQMGYEEVGAVEIICEDKYNNYFEKCAKITINDNEYEVFRNMSGGRAVIQKLYPNLLKVVLRRK
jgi:hypothetical protein